MLRRSTLPESVETYIARMHPESPVENALRDRTESMPEGGMQIGPDQGAFLALLVRLLGVRNALEIGTFTGYSALRVAQALPDDGRLVCLDVSDAWTSMGRTAWGDAGVEHKIDLRLAPALESLAALEAEGARFDFAFIDADKPNTPTYYEVCLRLVRPGGLIAIDNVLWDGRVAADDADDEDTSMFRQLNAAVRDDPRVDHCLVSIGDGLLLARPKA